MKKTTLLLIVTSIFFLGLPKNLHVQILTPTHNFYDGSMEPFHDCTITSQNYTKVIKGHVKTFWSSILKDAYFLKFSKKNNIVKL